MKVEMKEKIKKEYPPSDCATDKAILDQRNILFFAIFGPLFFRNDSDIFAVY